MSEMITAQELARRLKLRPSTIKRWAIEGMIPAIRITGKVLRFDPQEVEKALRERAAKMPQQTDYVNRPRVREDEVDRG